jgi:hypothetical protein
MKYKKVSHKATAQSQSRNWFRTLLGWYLKVCAALRAQIYNHGCVKLDITVGNTGSQPNFAVGEGLLYCYHSSFTLTQIFGIDTQNCMIACMREFGLTTTFQVLVPVY